MKYENKRNGQIFEVVGEVDKKYNTVFLRNVETGKEQTVSTATIKRWYKVLEEQEPETAEQEPAEVVLTEVETVEPEQEPAADTEPAEQEQEPAKKNRKKREKKEMTADATALHQYAMKTCEEVGGTVWEPATNIKFRSFKVGGKMFVKYSWTSKSIVLQVRAIALGLDEPKHPAKHTYNDKYVFTENTEQVREEIKNIIAKCYKWQADRNAAKAKKK